MTLAIETHRLTRYFDDFLRSTASIWRVERGHLLRLPRAHGAGKSTTIKMLTGLLAPSDGEMLVLGKNVLDSKQALEVKQRVGVIPEDLALFDNLTAREIPDVSSAACTSCPETPSAAGSNELLELLGLEGEEKKLTLEYSHGMKKKLALAAALLPNPDLLFLDEPFEGWTQSRRG